MSYEALALVAPAWCCPEPAACNVHPPSPAPVCRIRREEHPDAHVDSQCIRLRDMWVQCELGSFTSPSSAWPLIIPATAAYSPTLSVPQPSARRCANLPSRPHPGPFPRPFLTPTPACVPQSLSSFRPTTFPAATPRLRTMHWCCPGRGAWILLQSCGRTTCPCLSTCGRWPCTGSGGWGRQGQAAAGLVSSLGALQRSASASTPCPGGPWLFEHAFCGMEGALQCACMVWKCVMQWPHSSEQSA